jgi:hypothetical protein
VEAKKTVVRELQRGDADVVAKKTRAAEVKPPR